MLEEEQPRNSCRHRRHTVRSGNDAEEQPLPEDKNQSEIETIEDLKKKLQKLEEKKLKLTNQRNKDMSRYEKEIMDLRLEIQRGEALRGAVENEKSFARREAQVQMNSTEDELNDIRAKLLELQVLNDKYRHKVAEIEKMFQSAQWQWEEERQKFAVERDNIRRVYLAEVEFLIEEKTQTEKACQDMNAVLQNTLKKLRDMEAEHHGCGQILRLQASHLDFKDREKERLVRELEMSHYEKEIMKLRLELERGETLRQVLEGEMSFARKEAQVQMCSAVEELKDIKAKLLELQESFQLPFVPQGISTPCGPAPDVRWGEARHRFYILSGTNTNTDVSP